MASNKFKTRIKTLFEEIEQLAGAPDSELMAMRAELESLRARLAELEAQVSEEPECLPDTVEVSERAFSSEIVQEAQQTRPGAPIIYEKERVGFAYTDERVLPLQLSTLEPLDANNALKAPLVESGKPIGTVVVEGQPEKDWAPEDAGLTEAVARQVSLQIQNLRLLAAAERARAEAQAATRRFTHESWENFLDAIHQSEQIGYAYDQNGVEPVEAGHPDDADIKASVSVLEEHIGNLYLKGSPERPLQEEDHEFVSAVARQLGQQVENLRLLADASRARAEAEEATRRLSRQNWQEFMTNEDEERALAFIYDQNQVVALNQPLQDVDYSQPLVVRGEPIGEIAISGGRQLSPEEASLLSAIATQTSLHLESLRLTEELQRRAAELQELDRLKSSFLANMSHELRTPLNSILGFSDVMLEGIDGDLTPYMENDLKLIQKNGKHLLHLINDVLDMAKIESGRMNLHPEKFKLQEVFDEVTSITSTLASEKNLSLFVDPDSDMEVEVTADMTRIRQVMINLVNNSIKFTETGKIVICAKKHDADTVKITVKDTGIGVPASHLETIFQEFAQVDTSTTRKVGGTGLGLPISRKLVEMHGGRMWAESTGVAGEGTTLIVLLPIEARIAEIIEKTSK